jgi:hypothetical protein
MNKIKTIVFLIIFCSQAYPQNIAFMKMSNGYGQYLNNEIIRNLNNNGLKAKRFSNVQLFNNYNNNILSLTNDQIANLKMFNHDFIILHKSEKSDKNYNDINEDTEFLISKYKKLKKGTNWQSEFYVINVNTNQFAVVSLAISTFNCGNKLKSCSNIDGFVKSVKDFINVSNNNTDGKFKVVRVKERSLTNNHPIAIDVYDKSLSLKVGDNIIITRMDEVKIPGEKETRKSETTIGEAKITEDFNKPLYTAKLISNAGFNMIGYKDGEENYNAVKGESIKMKFDPPKIMVIPKKIDPSKFVNGEYQLSKEEKMLIAAFKNKFEDNKFTTYGFESTLKPVLENRQMNDNVQEDIKSKILEAAGMDFFVEYENLDLNNTKCDKVFDFKIRNYSTGEDVASDVKNLNSCGTSDDYKNFAETILNSGAVSKINTQFSSLIDNGRKVSVIFTISNSSQTNFNKELNGFKLKDHIENCLQGLAFNGILDIEGVVNFRMETTVNIPITNENTGKSYTTNTFSEDIISYLKKNANVDCEITVSKQIVNIKIN